MAQTLGDARPPMHHLIMGGLAPYGAWRQVTFLWRFSLPRTLCMAVCKTQCSGRARAGFFFPLFARANDRLSLLRFLAEFAIGSWAIHFTIGAPWQ